MTQSKEAGIKEMLTSLGLLCLVSLLLALLSLIFLLKISPMSPTGMRDMRRTEQLTIISPEEYVVVYEVTLALCALTLSLNLCCLLVCAIQFLFAVKLVKSAQEGQR
jgi:ABC-type sulfate transport system permease component